MLYPMTLFTGGLPNFQRTSWRRDFADPIAHIGRQICENENGLEAGMQIRAEAVGVGKIHPRRFANSLNSILVPRGWNRKIVAGQTAFHSLSKSKVNSC